MPRARRSASRSAKSSKSGQPARRGSVRRRSVRGGVSDGVSDGDGHGALHPRQVRLLNRAKKTPSVVLSDRRCLKPWFCRAFLDHCHDVALRRPDDSLEVARLAVQLATQAGDPHLLHQAHGVLTHSRINRVEFDRAAEVLADYKASALTCCEACASDWHLRQSDLLVERRDPEAAGHALERSLHSLGPGASRDDIAYICFIRCIRHHHAGDIDRALADIAQALRDLDLDRPRGYFLDLLAFTACFLFDRGERHHDQQALEDLREFRQRIKGLEGWRDVRLRYAWVEGLLLGRLGQWKMAHERLDLVWTELVQRGPAHHALAAAIDSMLLYARHPVDHNYRVILRIFRACETRLQLERPERKRLRLTKTQVGRHPEKATYPLEALRRTLVVPVSSILGWAWWRRK